MALMMNWVERMDNPGIIDDDSEDNDYPQHYGT